MCCTSVSREIHFNGIYNFKHLKDTYFAKNKFMYFWGLFFIGRSLEVIVSVKQKLFVIVSVKQKLFI